MREQRYGRELSAVTVEMGALYVTHQSILSCLKECWDGVRAPSKVGVHGLHSYLSTHINVEKVREALPLQLKTAHWSLIHRALDLQKDWPFSGLGVVAPKVCMPLEYFFVRLMEMAYKHLLGWGGRGGCHLGPRVCWSIIRSEDCPTLRLR